MTDELDYSIIPARIMDNLNAYFWKNKFPGRFLYSVLINDLYKSIVRADDEMLNLLPLLVHYIHRELPSACHGSIEKVWEWMHNVRNEKQEEEKND